MIPLPEGQTPRRWQVEAWEALRQGLALWDSVLVSAATGTGKGTLLAGLCSAWSAKGRVLFLVHREELVRDVAARIGRLGVEALPLCGKQTKAEREAALQGRVVCATVQTLRAPVVQALLAAGPVAWVLTDEAHHGTAPSYRRVYGLLAAQEGVKVRHVGVTATPYRFMAGGGLAGLGSVFKEHVYDYPLVRAVEDGVLVPLRGLALHTGADLRQVDLSDDAAVEAALDAAERNAFILSGWQEHAHGRLTVGFAAGVEHSKHLAEMFNAAGVPSAAVWGADPERAEKIAALRAGRLRVLWNCALLTEGVDVPEVACVLLARPTDSPGLYAQMVGRGTRTAPGKVDCLVLDCADMTERHDLMGVGMLQEGEEEKRSAVVALKPGDRVEHRHDTARADGNVVELLHSTGMVTVLWMGRETPELCPIPAVRRLRPVLDGVEVQVQRQDLGAAVALEVALLGGRPEGWYHYRSSNGTDRYTLAGPRDRKAGLQLVREAPGVWSAWDVSAPRPGGQVQVFCLHEGGPLTAALGAALDGWKTWKPVAWESFVGGVTPAQEKALKKWGMRRTTAGMSKAEAVALMQTRITGSQVDAERKRRRQGKRGAA